ncbi:MAG: hypothetical protein NC336_09750, partial [Clostridium sp.]|nr:hypothetical protein [Clostridium sp.]
RDSRPDRDREPQPDPENPLARRRNTRLLDDIVRRATEPSLPDSGEVFMRERRPKNRPRPGGARNGNPEENGTN